ncbi:MAG TPA: hypothetical protein VD978_20370 [Azospirillum sp.]|nr:hypothetical protein [Azospirillum sp.]
MDVEQLTDLGRRAVAGQVLLARLHLRRQGERFRIYAGDDAVTVDLDADAAARTACRLCGVVPEPWFLSEVIASAVEG